MKRKKDQMALHLMMLPGMRDRFKFCVNVKN